MKFKYLLVILLSSSVTYSVSHASFEQLAPETKIMIFNNLDKTKASKAASTSSEINQSVKGSTQCPVLGRPIINENQALANATTMHELIGTNINAHGRTWKITYLQIGFEGTFSNFMVQNNINALNPLPVAAANQLLGNHYVHDPHTECVYDLHDDAMDGATLVIKG